MVPTRAGRCAGFVRPLDLVVFAIIAILCTLAYVGLGRLGWAWWQRVLAISASIFVLTYGLLFVLAAVDKRREKRSRPPPPSPSP